MNGASYTTPGMSGTTPKQGEFKKGGHGGGWNASTSIDKVTV